MNYDCELGEHLEPVPAVEECSSCGRQLCRSCRAGGCCGHRPARGIREPAAVEAQDPLYRPKLGVDVCATEGCGGRLPRHGYPYQKCVSCRRMELQRAVVAPPAAEGPLRNRLPGEDDLEAQNQIIRRLVALGLNAAEIAQEVGLTHEAAHQRIHRMGLSTMAAMRVL